MPVITHQCPCINAPMKTQRHAIQEPQPVGAVLIVTYHVSTFPPARRYVINSTCEFDPKGSSHNTQVTNLKYKLKT
jgi:hypothetical protein